MERVYFFCLVDRIKLLRFLHKGDFGSLDLLSPKDFDVELDSKKNPNERNFIEIEIKEIIRPDYRKFNYLKYLGERIVVFERHQLNDCQIINNVLHSSTDIYPLKKKDIRYIKSKKRNFVMVGINVFLPQGVIRYISKWEDLLKDSTNIFLSDENKVSTFGEGSLIKVLVEKLGPTSQFTTGGKIFNSDYLERYFSPRDWCQIISEDVHTCKVKPLKPGRIENNPYLSRSCIRAKIQKIANPKQEILTA